MITGIDYIFKTEENAYFYFYAFELKVNNIWANFYKEHDLEDGLISVFYSKNKNMFDTMDDAGYSLDENGQGSFLIMFNEQFSDKENRITLVLPDEIENSIFCMKIYDLVKGSVKMSLD